MKQKLFTAVAFTAITMMSFQVSTSSAQLIDDFSSPDLSAYTTTVILNNAPSGASTSAFEAASGVLQLNTSAYNGEVEQYAFIRNGQSLGVGQEVLADFADPILGNRNFGLYVGGTAPVASDGSGRADFISVYSGPGPSSRVFQRGFDGGDEYANLFADPTGAVSSMFIARTATNTFEAGFYDTAGRQIVSTLNPTTANSANFVGFYADARAQGIVGNADNFRIGVAVPEPGSMIVLGLTGLAVMIRRRK